MRTSALQFQLMVEYMERNGDLSKPTEGPQGRVTNVQRWAELAEILNADATGDTKAADKWRKVWSDFKNNTKKKAARIYRAAQGTGGGPASNIRLSDLEQRVLSLVGTQAATGIVGIAEVGLGEDVTEPPPDTNDSISYIIPLGREQETCPTIEEDWNRPGTSAQLPLFPSTHVTNIREPVSANTRSTNLQETVVDLAHVSGMGVPLATGTPLPSVVPAASDRPQAQQSPTPLPPTPRRRKRARHQLDTSPVHRRTRTQTQSDLARQAFVRSDCEWRAFQQETERERNRLRETELRHQERWLELFAQFLALSNRIVDILDKKYFFII